MKAFAYVATIWVCLGIMFYMIATRPEIPTTDVDGLANCIAEQSYTHPMDDKWQELVNAVDLCTEGE